MIFIAAILFVAVACAYEVRPFEITWSESSNNDLKQRILATRWPSELEDVHDWSQGVPLSWIKNISNYFISKYDMKKELEQLNKFSHFKVNIGDQDVHFVHQKSSHQSAKPLILIHGWPGSFWECSKIIPILTEPQLYGGNPENAFHVVCPSIPGYGFSSAPTKKGFDQYQCAQLFDELMFSVLGYTSYYVQGGDWGSVIASFMSTLPSSQERIIGLHLNFVPMAPPITKGISAIITLIISMFIPWLFYDQQEISQLLQLPQYLAYETGYFHEHSTRPQTISYALSDSPIGLMSWIFEKFFVWSDCKGDPLNIFTPDELLTNFLIYWNTNTTGG